MNIFLGDEITLTKQTAWITGKVNGVKLDKGHLQMISLEHIDLWLNVDQGWRIVDENEDSDLNE
jgi:hypothetical protein